jgi:hypothetical protein
MIGIVGLIRIMFIRAISRVPAETVTGGNSMAHLTELANARPEQLATGSSPALQAALERRMKLSEDRGGFNSFIGSHE